MVRLTKFQASEREKLILDVLNLRSMSAIEIAKQIGIKNHQSIYYRCKKLVKLGKLITEIRKNPNTGIYTEYYCLIIDKIPKRAKKALKAWNHIRIRR